MKTNHHRARRLAPALPRLSHVVELVVGIIIFTGGQGLLSVFVSANADVMPPTVPVNLQVGTRTASSIDLSWDPSTDDVGVTGYRIYRGGTSIGTSPTPSYSNTGLTPNTGYTYTVSAYDAEGNDSGQSAPTTTSTLADTTSPTAPSNLRQTGSTVSSINIAWDASTDDVGVTGYEVYRNGSFIKSQAGTAFTDTGLQPYTTYTYNVLARDAAGNISTFSSPLYGGTAADELAPSVPDNLRKQSSTVSSITLAWNSSTDNVAVEGYRIYRNGTQVGTTNANTTSYTDTGLTVSSSYTYTVLAYDRSGNASDQSQPFNTASSDDVTAPTAPSNVRSTHVYDTSVDLAWDASTDDVGVTGYKVYRNGAQVGVVTGRSFTDTGLTPVTNYTYTVKGYDAANNTSVASSDHQVQTEFDTTKPSVPTNLRSPSQTDSTVTLEWDASTDNVGVTGYDIYRNNMLITTTAATQFTDTGLDVDTAYSYQVRAHDAYTNNSDKTAAITVRTLTDQIAPASPTALHNDAQTTSTVDISWAAATDDVAVVGYCVYRDNVFIAYTSNTAYADSLLHYNQQYVYTVTAVDAAGNESPRSSPLNVTTDPDVTAPSVSLTAPPNGQNNVQYTIPVSATASDDLDLNRVEFFAGSKKIATITQAPYSFNWDTYEVPNGTYLIIAKAFDGAGNATSESVSITINNPPPPLRGDINGDHKVNIYDLSLLLSRYNKSGTGDFNNNGRIDIFDLSVLLGQYGKDNNYR